MMTNIMKNHINLKNLNKNLGATLPLRRAQMTPCLVAPDPMDYIHYLKKTLNLKSHLP
jgi:hypothetical protein